MEDLFCMFDYGPILFDDHCNEPIAWGYCIHKNLGEKALFLLRQFGEVRFISTWLLITQRLTMDQAIDWYGPITAIREDTLLAITFGSTTFTSKEFIGCLQVRILKQ